jgi:hypothetical protein
VDVRSAADGSVRGSVAEGWNTPGMLSEDGEYLVVGGQDNCMFYNFSGGAYQPALPRYYPGDGTGEGRGAAPRVSFFPNRAADSAQSSAPSSPHAQQQIGTSTTLP